MSTKHTPGPWRYTDGGIIDTPNQTGLEIADVYGADINDKRGPELCEAMANAHLIAAAPELKRDLEKANRQIWQLCDMVNSYAERLGLGKKVNAGDWVKMDSLAKAEGRE